MISRIILADIKFPQGNINGDTMLMFSFQFIQNPGNPEGALSHLSSHLLKCFDGSFVDTITFVDQVASSNRFTQIYMSDDDTDMNLFLSLFGLDLLVVLTSLVFSQQTRCEKANPSFLNTSHLFCNTHTHL